MVEIGREQFDCMTIEAKVDLLFDVISRLEPEMKSANGKLDSLLASPWRMAIPPVSMKAVGAFIVILALIIKGDLQTAIKLIGALFGVM